MIDDMEVIVFKVITASGIAKGLAYKALDKVENRDFKGAYKLLGEANEYIDEAHEIQKGIIEKKNTRINRKKCYIFSNRKCNWNINIINSCTRSFYDCNGSNYYGRKND